MHKEESPSRIQRDVRDRLSLWATLQSCNEPLILFHTKQY